MRLRIVYFSEKQGNAWEPWPEGVADHIDEALLEHKRKNRGQAQDWIWIEGIQCHAICLGDGRIWDVINTYRSGVNWRNFGWSKNFNHDEPPDWRKCLMPEKEEKEELKWIDNDLDE